MTTTETTTETTLTVTTLDESDPAVLLLHYPTQTHPQPCYVELNCEAEELLADVRGDINNARPERIAQRRALRWTIPCLTASAANALLAEIAPHAAEVLRGYESRYDRNANKRGYYTNDAWEAVERIGELCEAGRFDDSQKVHAWDAHDYFGNIGTVEAQAKAARITADTTDAEIYTRASELLDEAQNDAPPAYLRHANVASYLRSVRDRLASESDNG